MKPPDHHTERPLPPPERIDFVYTWVDGNHPVYQEQLRAHARSPADLNPERWRDAFSILKYSLRSVHRHVDWVGDVHIVTNRPQCPAWLDASREDVHVHHVEDLMDPEYLPCFNSDAIETYVHELPTSSDYMVYLCDDYLFGRRTDLEDFCTPDGRIKVFGTWRGENFWFRIHTDRWVRLSWWLGLAHLEHTPHFLYKPWYREMYESRPADLRWTRAARFRTPGALKRVYLNTVHLLSTRRPQVEVVPGRELLEYHLFHMIRNDLEVETEAFRQLREARPKFYCLNDDQGPAPDPRVVELVMAFLEEAYPDPSPWELA